MQIVDRQEYRNLFRNVLQKIGQLGKQSLVIYISLNRVMYTGFGRVSSRRAFAILIEFKHGPQEVVRL